MLRCVDGTSQIDAQNQIITFTTYHAAKRWAVIAAGSHTYGYDANGSLTSRDGSTIGYTSYNLPGVINAGSNSSTLSYGAFRNRYKQVAVTAGVTETTIYIGGILEKMTRSGVTEYRHRIEGGNGTAAIHTRRSSGTPLTETYYVHRDHLGSPELITNAAGAVVVRLSFGAYGERRDSDWDGAVSSADMTAIGNTTRRGFTGHEHLDSVSLIHMNGRVFEPIIGRMLAPDPIVQVGAAQSVNCYAYVWNNPLTRTDPSGWEAEKPTPMEEIVVTGSRDDQQSGELPRLEMDFDFSVMERLAAEVGSDGRADGVGGKGQESQSQAPCALSAPTGQYVTAAGVDARFDAATERMLSTALAKLNDKGITPVITSGYRSSGAQALLRNSDSPFVVTPAQVSWHQVGAAVDFGPNNNAGNFDAIVSEMTQAGFAWGGNFQTPDRPHFQSQPAGTSPSAELVEACARAGGGD